MAAMIPREDGEVFYADDSPTYWQDDTLLQLSFTQEQAEAFSQGSRPKMYAIGGDYELGKRQTFECYDFQLEKWCNIGKLKFRRCAAAVAVYNNEVWVIGGENCDLYQTIDRICIYNPCSGEWRRSEHRMIYDRVSHRVAVLRGKLYAVGGKSNEESILNSVEVYDEEFGWDLCDSMLEPRKAFGLAVFADDKLVAAGGNKTNDSPSSSANTLEQYSTITGRWRNLWPSLSEELKELDIVIDGDRLFAFGYMTSTYIFYTTLFSADDFLTAASWTSVNTFLVPTYQFNLGVHDRTVYIVGGISSLPEDRNEATSKVFKFDLDSMVVQECPHPMTKSRHRPGVAIL